jgi:menaquinol-cytochrome c reductase iron-sulfur subunit
VIPDCVLKQKSKRCVCDSGNARHVVKKADLPDQQRRDFLAKASAVGIGAVITLVPAGAGIVTLFDPLRHKSATGNSVFVTTVNALPNDGRPRRFQIIADRTDAWNKFPQVPVGAVYLRRLNETKIEALNVTCPHAGCPVDFKQDTNSFLCPCHDSKFKLDGTLADLNSPSPRAMDSLEVEIRNGSEIWVKFQNFEAGKAMKLPLT